MEWIETSPFRYRDEGRNLIGVPTQITMKTMFKTKQLKFILWQVITYYHITYIDTVALAKMCYNCLEQGLL